MFWKSTKTSKHELQPKTLIPNQQFFKDEQTRPGNNTLIKEQIELSKEEDDESMNDVVSYDDFPWQHPPEEYSLAITGKAFNLLLQDSE